MSIKIVLGICGGIAAYKAPELVRQFVKAGVQVTPVLTSSAEQFVSPLSLGTVAGRDVVLGSSFMTREIPHLSQIKDADALVVAPATANFIARSSAGMADDMLSAMFLSFQGPKGIVPAMHTEMWDNALTQANVERLRELDVSILGPGEGDLACGDTGLGRMVDLPLIVQFAQNLVLGALPLQGKRVLIASGGTVERIDAVREITNASSGKMGEALAHIAAFNGAQVIFVSTKPLQVVHPGIRVVGVESVDDMKSALSESFDDSDVVLMPAAVSDYTVDQIDGKIKREDALTLTLKGTPDILRYLSEKKSSQLMIGFCLEEKATLRERARQKLESKGLDYIVANTPDNLGADHREVMIISAQDATKEVSSSGPLFSVAYDILATIFS